MSDLATSIFSTLGSYAGLSALVGTRIYQAAAPQSPALPYVVWSRVSLVQANSLSGSAESGGLDNSRIQVSTWARKLSEAKAVDAQIRLAMIAASGFKSILLDARDLEYEPDTKLFGVMSDFSVWLKT